MKKLIALSIGLFLSFTGLSQSCLQEGIIFTMQAQIDSFQINYPGCMEIEGDVTISGSDITNLNGLSILTSIGGYLSIAQNDNLTSLTGLSGLTAIGSLVISSNAGLTSLIGLEGLTFIGGNLAIYNNDVMTNLTGLDNLISIGGKLEIGANDVLPSLTGLDTLTSIGASVDIYLNDTLINLTGLESLSSIGGDLGLSDNKTLFSLAAFDGLTFVGGDIYIWRNAVLSSLIGLDNIDAGSINHLAIGYNDSLFTCEVQSICIYLAIPNSSSEIYHNATGCYNRAEVEAACGVGLNENNSSEDQFTIAPNPSSNQITIETSSTPTKFQISIFNLNGQELIRRQIMEPVIVIDISKLPGGVYFVRLTGERTVSVEKFIKMD